MKIFKTHWKRELAKAVGALEDIMSEVGTSTLAWKMANDAYKGVKE